MRIDEYKNLPTRETEVYVHASEVLEAVKADLPEGTEIPDVFTLLYGYDLDRNTFHVYMERGDIVRYVYDFDGREVFIGHQHVWSGPFLTPSKRAYPEATNAAFARLLLSKGVAISFTTYSDEQYERFNERSGSHPLGIYGATY